MPTQRDTFPWMGFTNHLRKLERETWMQLGEAVSLIEFIAKAPLEPEAERKLRTAYMLKGALATIAVEGKTLEEKKIREFLGESLELPSMESFPEQKINNIVDACESIVTSVGTEGEYSPLTPEEIMNYNSLVLLELEKRENVVPGELRQHSVVVGINRSVPARDCETLLEEFCAWINGIKFPANMEKSYSILAAIASHLYFVWIHPFGDGNGRTARLIEFRSLLRAGLPPHTAQLLSIYYSLTRTEYFRQLDRANRSGSQMSDFFSYSVYGLVGRLKEQIGAIQDLQRETVKKVALLKKK
jgi:cell filamentation protein, protein adenylyltransferase